MIKVPFRNDWLVFYKNTLDNSQPIKIFSETNYPEMNQLPSIIMKTFVKE